MRTKTKKYYVVWSGRKKGVFDSWEDCKKSIEGFSQARYKGFENKEEAEKAFNNHYYDYFKIGKQDKKEEQVYTHSKIFNTQKTTDILLASQLPIIDSICVDAACSGNPGVMEYQGVYIKTGQRLFYYKYPYGTNNIGEFLAIVHGLSYLKRHKLPQPLYSDSVNAIKWVQARKCKTKLPLNEKTAKLYEYIHRAEAWLENNTYTTRILKWNTDSWSEIPADFGRKH